MNYLFSFAGMASISNLGSSCSSTTVQSIVNNLGLEGTIATVDLIYHLDSNATIAAFKAIVGATNFHTDILLTCAICINGSTSAGAHFGFAALLPDTWDDRIM